MQEPNKVVLGLKKTEEQKIKRGYLFKIRSRFYPLEPSLNFYHLGKGASTKAKLYLELLTAIHGHQLDISCSSTYTTLIKT